MQRQISSVESNELKSSSLPVPHSVMIFSGKRKVVVIDGVIYYSSSGDNSSHANVWFPILLIRGTQAINYDAFPSYLVKENIKACGYTHLGYFLKFQTEYCAETREKGLFRGADLLLDELAARLPTKETIIISARLSGEHFPRHRLEEVDLTPKEKFLTTQPIYVEEKPVFETTNPDKINKWAIEQGATVPRAVLVDLNFPLADAAIQAYLQQGMSLFMIAAVNGRADIVKRLIPKQNASAFVNQLRHDGWSPFMLAAGRGHVAVIDELLKHGANKDLALPDGWTPLMLAAADGDVNMCTLLLQHGANANQKLPNGMTALMIAEAYGHANIVEILTIQKEVKEEPQPKPPSDEAGVTHLELDLGDLSVATSNDALFSPSKSKKSAVEKVSSNEPVSTLGMKQT